uniref:Uncharacterized protein n=1 Tax=Tanacetum cinerariifolium TaxID=118510 RepID=A0A6L2N9J1_TANCI|nr:hypothetical protein [Tanacetum cinerariifolium]
MSADVSRGHDGDGGGDDRSPTHHIPTGCGGCFVNRGKGTQKPNLDGRKAGRLHTRQETQNLGLNKIIDDKAPEIPLYYPSWQKVLAEWKAAILTKIETQFDLTPHMQSQRWTDINTGIQQHLQKLYNTNKASLKEEMLRLQALGSNTPSGVPYTEKEINALARKGKQRGHLPGVGMVLPGRSTDVLISPPPPLPQCTYNSGDVEKLKKKNNGSGGCEDDEMANDEEDGEDGDS